MTMKIKQIILVAASGILTGCGLLGPDYVKPQVNSPQKWSADDKNIHIESTNLAEVAWWKKFNDPQLNQLIESALQNNNNLQMAMGNIMQAQASLKKIQMGWLPTVSMGGVGFTGQSFNPGFQNTSSYPLANNISQNNPQNFDGYAAGFMPSYTLNVFELVKQNQIAKLSLEMQKQSANAVALGVIGQVAGSYFSLLGLHKQLQLQQELLADAKEMRKYNLIQYQNGSISDLNIEGIDQYIAGLEGNIPKIQNDITQTENALQVLTNNNPGKIKTNRDFDQVTTTEIVPVNLPSSVLKSRPDIVAAEYQLQIANANIGAVTSMFFPSISLTGMLGQGSMQLSNLFNAGADFWMGQLGAAMPLFNMGLYAEADKARGSYYTAYYNYIQTVRTAFSQVDNGLANHDSLDKVASQQNIALQKAQSLQKIANKQYTQGSVGFSDTLGFKLNVDYAKASLNQIKIQQLNSIVNLYQVLGGGYLAESQLTKSKKFGDSHDI